MSERNNDNLENFFRDHAQNHNIEFREADWKKLEASLDQEMPVPGGFWSFFRRFLIIPLVLILALLTWLSVDQLSNSRQKEAAGEAANKTELKKEINQPGVSEPGMENTQGKEIRSENDGSLTNSGNPTIVDRTDSHENLSTGNDRDSEKNINVAIERHEILDQGSAEKKIGYVVSEDGANISGKQVYSELHFLFSIPPSSNIDSRPVEIRRMNPGSVLYPERSNKITFAAGVGYSPDFSTVGMGNFVAPGARWAGLLELGLSKRFLVNTGVVWVQNKYEAYGEDYHAPSRYWRNGIVADQAYGECIMIDIPLNLRYNVLLHNRHQLFISGGASTYFVLKEDYYFHYEQEDPDLPQHWGTEKMTPYPFGIINFSVGYQYALSKRGNIQIEPFIKFPTTGIGWGNVDLHSMGAYFIYKYRIGK